MKALMIVFLWLVASVAYGQSTSITATITDTDGQTWNNGTVTATFVPGPPNAYRWPGGAIPLTIAGTMNGSGTLTLSLPDNSTITPVGSQWRFTLCPNASAGCVSTAIAVSGSSENLSSQLSSIARGPRFPATAWSYGYLDVEVTPTPANGAMYWNVTNQITRQWNGTAWQDLSGGGGTGTVTSVSGLTPLFSVADATTTPTFALSTAAADTVFGNCATSTATPSYCTITSNMLPEATTNTPGIVTVTGPFSYVPTVTNSGFGIGEVTTYSGTGGGLTATGIYLPASIIPSGGTNFLQINSLGDIEGIAGINAACAGPQCFTQQINFAPCSTLTTLSAAITNSQTTGITVASTACLPITAGVIGVSSNSPIEYIAYTSIVSDVLQGVTRGFWGSPAQAFTSGAAVVLAQQVYSLSASTPPSFVEWQSGAIWYNPPAGGICSACMTTTQTYFGKQGQFTAGIQVTGAVSVISLSSSVIYSGALDVSNPGIGSSCGTTGQIFTTNPATYSWFLGVANDFCSTPASSVFGIVSGPTPGTLPSSGQWGFFITPLTYNVVTQGSFNSAAPQTTANCATSGTAVFSQPLQGASAKEVYVTLNACVGTASYTFPTAYTVAPSTFGSAALTALATSISTTAVTVTAASATTGTFGLMAY